MIHHAARHLGLFLGFLAVAVWILPMAAFSALAQCVGPLLHPTGHSVGFGVPVLIPATDGFRRTQTVREP